MAESLFWRVLATSPRRGNLRFALAVLAARADDQGIVRMSQYELADLLGLEVESARLLVRSLKRGGDLQLLRKGGGKGSFSVYRVTVPPAVGEGGVDA